MVFTRSEHLARHERKHTGEKPYKCVVENCGRMFSRFDNMMQHTQTHEKKKTNASVETVEDHARPKKARAALANHPLTDSPIQMQEETVPWFQHPDPYQVHPLDYSSMMSNRKLPPPDRRFSIPTLPYESGSHSFYPCSTPYSLVKTHFQNTSTAHFYPQPPPPPILTDNCYRRSHSTSLNRFSWPSKKDEYRQSNHSRRSSTSTASTDSGHSSSPPHFTHEFNVKRRISVDALQTPIENLKTIQLDEELVEKDAVDITQDEFEALEAFGQFRSSSVVGSLPLTPPSRDSHTLSSQVCAIRQRVPTSKLSFSRPVSHCYVD
ncbi:hypothetical protein BY458DRAFT_428832 [Sporodiniella umbellata]|nr:hypothetical protein BY458DRAFT_428832 [Sporodiniella umbellata]